MLLQRRFQRFLVVGCVCPEPAFRLLVQTCEVGQGPLTEQGAQDDLFVVAAAEREPRWHLTEKTSAWCQRIHSEVA
eukprot:7927512-Lingulodinium_polyedra.AAC.1